MMNTQELPTNAPLAVVFKTVDWQTNQNAEIAASAAELVLNTNNRKVDAYNLLTVQNFDANSDIEIRFDDLNNPSRRFTVQKNGGFINLGPDIPIWYRQIWLVNLNAAAIVAATAVTVNGAKVVPTAIQAINANQEVVNANTSNQFGISFG